MSTLARDLGHWFWRLIPANPILVRVVHAAGRRRSHFLIRLGYLAMLAGVVGIGVLAGGTGGGSLSELAKNATRTFFWASSVQLFFVCVIAPIFAAAAITQEKDSQTFSILLSTPLSNSQIVLGSLLSRLYFVLALLLASLPLFCIMMVYGGVTGSEITLSIALSAATALVTSSTAIAISVINVGTGRTIFSFYLAIFLYLISLGFLATLPAFIPPESPAAPGSGLRMSWLAAFHPFLSLGVVLNKTPAPDYPAVAHYGFPSAFWLAYPHLSFIVMTFVASALMVSSSIWFTRRGGKVGEPTWIGRLLRRDSTGDRQARRLRHVWHNPVAWREAETGAAAGSGGKMRIVLMLAGLVAGVTLMIQANSGMPLPDARLWLKALVGIEICLGLFVATATAATSMTREKEGNTLDLLLTTPLQSRQIIGGKIRGLFSFAVPMLALPAATVGMFVLWDLVRGKPWLVYPETILTLPMVSAGFTLLACSVGLFWSVKQKRTIGAVLVSVGTVMGAFTIVGLCATQANSANLTRFSAMLSPFSPLTAVMLAVDPESHLIASGATPSVADVLMHRRLVFIASAIAGAIYLAISRWLHINNVRDFDMTIRRQSA